MPEAPSFVVERSNFAHEFMSIRGVVMAEMESALLAGRYILSDEVDRFECAFAEYVGCEHAVTVNSGTDALLLALEVLDISDGHEVITVANTFHATALAIARTGARPVLVDALPDTYLMDLSQVEAAVSKRTKAIIAVHLFGMPLNLTELRALAQRHGIALVEDCAQATGASIAGRKVGSWGDLGCFSFHPSKTLAGAGDGGAVTTHSKELAARLRSQRYFGQRVSKVHSHLGHNSKLDTLQAIVLYHKLQFLDQWNEQRRVRAGRYMEGLRGLPVMFQAGGPVPEHVYHLFQLRVSDGRRDELLAHLVAQRIDAVVRYPVPIHLQPAFEYLAYSRGNFPVSEHLALSNLCLPLRPDMTAEETRVVIDAVAEFHAR